MNTGSFSVIYENYCRNSDVVAAIRYNDKRHLSSVRLWLSEHDCPERQMPTDKGFYENDSCGWYLSYGDDVVLWSKTIGSKPKTQVLRPGDYILRDCNGKFAVCPAQDFEHSYTHIPDHPEEDIVFIAPSYGDGDRGVTTERLIIGTPSPDIDVSVSVPGLMEPKDVAALLDRVRDMYPNHRISLEQRYWDPFIKSDERGPIGLIVNRSFKSAGLSSLIRYIREEHDLFDFELTLV